MLQVMIAGDCDVTRVPRQEHDTAMLLISRIELDLIGRPHRVAGMRE